MARDTPVTPDAWSALRRLTPARIALGRAGTALPTTEVLAFGLAHARARDAVLRPLDVDALVAALASDGRTTLRAASAAPDRATYLVRPDLGRRLDTASAARLGAAGASAGSVDLACVVADGLSAIAVARHAPPLLAALVLRLPAAWTLAPIVVATQARVALGDEIGALLRARLVIVLIGERPGLSAPDSLGVYLTWAPAVGRTDAERNCVSNVRPAGLPYERAAHTVAWLAREACRFERSGVELKDASDGARLDDAAGGGPTLP